MSAASPNPAPKESSKHSPNPEDKRKKPNANVFYDPAEFTIRKRLAPHWPKRNCDVFVSNKTDVRAQKKRCETPS